MSNVIPFRKPRRVAPRSDRYSYMFGGCPVCGKPLLTNTDGNGPDISGTATLAVEHNDYGVCFDCGVYWHVGAGEFGSTWGEEAERNFKKIEPLRRVDPWFPPDGTGFGGAA